MSMRCCDREHILMWKSYLNCPLSNNVTFVTILELAGTHTEAAINKLTKTELVQLVLNTKVNMRAQISNLTAEVIQQNSCIWHLKTHITPE